MLLLHFQPLLKFGSMEDYYIQIGNLRFHRDIVINYPVTGVFVRENFVNAGLVLSGMSYTNFTTFPFVALQLNQLRRLE